MEEDHSKNEEKNEDIFHTFSCLMCPRRMKVPGGKIPMPQTHGSGKFFLVACFSTLINGKSREPSSNLDGRLPIHKGFCTHFY